MKTFVFVYEDASGGPACYAVDQIDAVEAGMEFTNDTGYTQDDVVHLLDLPSAKPLEDIQKILNGTEWDSSTLNSVAEVVRKAGYTVRDVE